MGVQPIEGVFDDGVLVVLIENLMEQARVDAQALILRGDLLVELQGILRGYQAVVAAMQDEHRVDEIGRMGAHVFVAFMQRAEKSERHLLDDQRVGHVALADRGIRAYAAG